MIAVLSAPTNLGLRPPGPGSVPGCAKAPEALREAGPHARLAAAGAHEAGVLLPGRYVDDADPSAGRLRNQQALVDHARRLADRLGRLLDDGHAPLVLGGDCSLLVGAGLALARRGRHGLAHLDGHTDFRHPGNSDACASLAGEHLAAAVGRHWPAVADLDGHGPYFAPGDVVHAGCRDDDDHLDETRHLLGAVLPARQVRGGGSPRPLVQPCAWPARSTWPGTGCTSTSTCSTCSTSRRSTAPTRAGWTPTSSPRCCPRWRRRRSAPR